MKKGPATIAGPFRGTLELDVALERVRNVIEGRAQLVADVLHGGNRGNGDQSGDQTIFDGGRALRVLDELAEHSGISRIERFRSTGTK